MDYENYSDWKGWLDERPFAELSVVETERFRRQLACLNIRYKNINALEIGYGNGGFIRFLQDNGSQVVGTEVQEPLLKAAKDYGVQAYRSWREVQDGPYDLIVAFDVLEHLTLDQLRDLFEHAQTLLHPDGVMLFRFPNADSFVGMGAQNGDFTHITAIAQSKLHQIVEPWGFTIKRFEAELVYPRNAVLHFVRKVCRSFFMKALGIGNSYFFATNVVAVLTRTPDFNRE